MKVKVTYTTDIKDIPYECWRLIDYKINSASQLIELLSELETQLASYNQEQDLFSSEETLDKIHKIRLILADYDQCLSDINTILSDWTEFRLQNKHQHVTLGTEQREDE
jgi:hypothetical protein